MKSDRLISNGANIRVSFMRDRERERERERGGEKRERGERKRAVMIVTTEFIARNGTIIAS